MPLHFEVQSRYNRSFEITPNDNSDIFSEIKSDGNIGNGILTGLMIDAKLADVHDWEIECIEAVPLGGVFEVKGLHRGVVRKGPIEVPVGVSLNSEGTQFTLVAGALDFVVGDKFKFMTSRGCALRVVTQGVMKELVVDYDSPSVEATRQTIPAFDGVMDIMVNRVYATGTTVNQVFALWRDGL